MFPKITLLKIPHMVSIKCLTKSSVYWYMLAFYLLGYSCLTFDLDFNHSRGSKYMKYINMLHRILYITTSSGKILNPGKVSTLSSAALWFNVREVIHHAISKAEYEIQTGKGHFPEKNTVCQVILKFVWK